MPKTHIIVHHTASDAVGGAPQINGVNNFHRDKDWGGGARAKKSSLGWFVQYHYFIEPSGQVIKTANEDELRWHAGNMNDKAIGVCMAGWFDPGHDAAPTAAQVASLKDLLTKLTKQFNIPADHIDPHRKYMPKSCYGYNLADDWARNLLKDSAPANFIIKASNGYGIGKVAPKPEVLQQYADEAGVEIPKNPDNTINWAEVDKRARKVV